MSDKEIIEMAAKSIGYKIAWNSNWHNYQLLNPVPDRFGYFKHPWNPLEDNSDAMDIMVKLGMNVNVFLNRAEPFTEVRFQHYGSETITEEAHMGDAAKATRRAIVRSAARIGKAMP